MIKNIFQNKRVKSFLWRTGMMVLAVLVSQGTEALPLLAEYTNPTTIVILGLVMGEISKALNVQIKEIEKPKTKRKAK